MSLPIARRLPVGAEPCGDSGVNLRVWAPGHESVSVVIDEAAFELAPTDEGYFEALVPGRDGSRYGFRLDDDAAVLADPASRSQPDGPDGLSEVIDPSRYGWHDEDWRGLPRQGQVLYELHVGTFTPEGTWQAAASRLQALPDLGITTVQMMPVGEFAGRFGWGYDGVFWFAPYHKYGRPDDLRAFVDTAHQLGLGVILDVVYNHLGPSGNVLPAFSRDYVSSRHKSEWGDTLNYDGPASGPVREMVLANVAYWIREFHMDGFRLDATQQIFDDSAEHLIAAITNRARAAAAGRDVFVIAENEPQDSTLLESHAEGGYGVDALYNDDFHHSARVAMTGVREAYYKDYAGTARELLAAVRWGFLFQGQYYSWQEQRRGTPVLDRDPAAFVACLENHDQVANSSVGRRLVELVHPGDLRAMTALLLLAPSTPLLFQGQELGSTAPWTFFADHAGNLGQAVSRGRREFMAQFPSLSSEESLAALRDPLEDSTFEACRLCWEPDDRGFHLWQLHHDLLAMRRSDAVFAAQRRPEGACLAERTLLLRWSEGPTTRLLVVNLGPDLDLARCAEPLIAPPAGMSWVHLWSSEHPDYGGRGTPAWNDKTWMLPAHSALVLGARTHETVACP